MYEQFLQKALRYCCCMKFPGEMQQLGKLTFLGVMESGFSIKLSAIFPFYMPGNYTLDVFSFAISILFITVKAVMAGKLVYQEILLKGSPFYIIL